MNIKDQLINLFPEADYISVTRTSRGYSLEISGMYESPTVSFKDMMFLSVMFGTTAIDLDGNSIDNSGCDTCGYGGAHGHTLQIDEVTKNEDFLIANIGKALHNTR